MGGAAYLAEYSDKAGVMEPGYFCTLCTARLNPAEALRHVLSDTHAMTYLKAHRNKQYMALCIGTLGLPTQSRSDKGKEEWWPDVRRRGAAADESPVSGRNRSGRSFR